MIRKGRKYSPEEILPFVLPKGKRKQQMDLDGDKIKVTSDRLYIFSKSIQCCKCGFEGSFFVKEKGYKDASYHLNLYGIRDGEEILFTKDHIVPRSCGGENNIDNYQTMCYNCNWEKADGSPRKTT